MTLNYKWMFSEKNKFFVLQLYICSLVDTKQFMINNRNGDFSWE